MRKPTRSVPLLCALIAVVAPLNLFATRPQPDALTLPQVLEKAGRYVLEYGEKMSLVVSIEHYSQWAENPGWFRLMTRMLVSEYAIVRVDDDWLGFRDTYQVDGKMVGDRQDRLRKVFLESPATAVRQGRQIADESARYNLGSIQRNFNTPTMALFFLYPKNQSRFQFKKSGENNINGVAVWKVQFSESQKPTIIRTSSGKDMPVKGTLWIDPAGGRVLKTHMQLETEARLGGTNSSMDQMGATRGAWADRRVHSSASITVTYTYDTRLECLVPSEMLETYEGPRANSSSTTDGTTKINCRATYADFRRFETGTKWSVPKSVPNYAKNRAPPLVNACTRSCGFPDVIQGVR